MTAEIALLNKLAVTLAADSAITINNQNGPKVYNSADKIFEGTTHDAIGVMVFNSPEISGIPVEVIVKMYRDHSCPGHFDTVFDFADAFLKHIEGIDAPPIVVEGTIRSLIWRRAEQVRDRIREASDGMVREASSEKYASIDVFSEAVDQHALEIIENDIALMEALPQPDWANRLTVADVLGAHAEAIGEFVDVLFEGHPLPVPRRERIMVLLAWSLLKEAQREVLTGLVFAGFGEKEKFPSLIAFEVYGLVAGRLKYIRTNRFDVDRKLHPDAAVFPFAQKEMVDRFMYGLDGEFLDLCNTFFSGSLDSLKGQLGGLLNGVDPVAQAAVNPAINEILAEFKSRVVPEHLDRLRSEFSDMVRSMPKQELAALAESLVHITSLKRKFSAGAESVGGPIDVAMITRAEGFVWVKRKHYFNASLNPRYFHRRYGGNNSAQQIADPTADAAN